MPEIPTCADRAYSRKACLADFLDDDEDEDSNFTPHKNKYNKQYSQNDSVVIAKNQQEFGHRKRIKPWRTGTKSQQQIVPKGFKKGFRG